MSGERILIVSDEVDLRGSLGNELSNQGFQITCESSGERGIGHARTSRPDLIVLDAKLPGLDGFEVCRLLRNDEVTKGVPIVILSARADDADVVMGLECGADDYVTKPFSEKVLSSRIKAILRWKTGDLRVAFPLLQVGEFLIDLNRGEFVASGESIGLTVIELRLLHFLASRPGWAFSRKQIAASVQGERHSDSDRFVDLQLNRLRKKLGKWSSLVQTVRGVGYRFKP